jgi:hypothetical protein
MEINNGIKHDQVRLTELEDTVGKAQELPPEDRARLGLAVRILAALGLIVLLSGLALLYCPDDRRTDAQTSCIHSSHW